MTGWFQSFFPKSLQTGETYGVAPKIKHLACERDFPSSGLFIKFNNKTQTCRNILTNKLFRNSHCSEEMFYNRIFDRSTMFYY